MQQHLTQNQAIKWGSFYTPPYLVDIVYQMVQNNKIVTHKILDTSAGYGDFARTPNFYGYDIDQQAIKHANLQVGNYVIQNSLVNVSRKKFQLSLDESILIVGNPPYNDVTSQYKKGQKGQVPIDEDLKSRDLGISFLKSYNKLQSDYICILHPLSYLIKKTNFQHLGSFVQNYQLIDNLVVSSNHFATTSVKTPFPIIIALYARNAQGMNFEDIQQMEFNIENGYLLKLNHFRFFPETHTKYKNKLMLGNYKHFHTMRDINALSRNATWLAQENSSSIKVSPENEFKFHYVHHFKQWFKMHQAEFWFLGNLDVIIPKRFVNNKKYNINLIIRRGLTKWHNIQLPLPNNKDQTLLQNKLPKLSTNMCKE